MRRREFIKMIAWSVAAWPIVSRAQQSALPVIGYLSGRSPEDLSAFLKGLNEAGYVDGRNVSIEYRWRRAELIGCRRWWLIWFIDCDCRSDH